MTEGREWVVTQQWIAIDGFGGYVWKLLEPVGDELIELAEGVASTRLGVRWQSWRARRRLGLGGWVNTRGTIP
jgi:hypothetical protein